jgi:hypothetical protein
MCEILLHVVDDDVLEVVDILLAIAPLGPCARGKRRFYQCLLQPPF